MSEAYGTEQMGQIDVRDAEREDPSIAGQPEIPAFGEERVGSARGRSALAGSAAAAVWALQEPVDQRIFGCDYSDVAVLGKVVTRGRAWRPAGFAVHLVNGALFGLVYHEVRDRRPRRPRALAVVMAVAEHLALYPLCYFVDRFHPGRGSPGVPPLLRNARAFGQATWRHALFGLVLGRLAGPVVWQRR